MTLEHLLRIGLLRPHDTNTREICRLLDAAYRRLDDARVDAISLETRFDAAYKALMQAALAALLGKGCRPDTGHPGHRMAVVQSLTATIGLDGERIVALDALREKRTLSDYTGENIDRVSTENCITEANTLLAEVTAWLAETRPDLLPDLTM